MIGSMPECPSAAFRGHWSSSFFFKLLSKWLCLAARENHRSSSALGPLSGKHPYFINIINMLRLRDDHMNRKPGTFFLVPGTDSAVRGNQKQSPSAYLVLLPAQALVMLLA